MQLKRIAIRFDGEMLQQTTQSQWDQAATKKFATHEGNRSARNLKMAKMLDEEFGVPTQSEQGEPGTAIKPTAYTIEKKQIRCNFVKIFM